MARRRQSPIMTPEVRAAILQAVAEGQYFSTAARAAGVADATARQARRRDPEFDAAVDRAEALAEQRLVESLRAGGRDWTTRGWILERRWPERWSRAEVRATLQANVTIDTAALAEAIEKSLVAVAKAHADFAQRDVDDPSGPQVAALAAAGAKETP